MKGPESIGVKPTSENLESLPISVINLGNVCRTYFGGKHYDDYHTEIDKDIIKANPLPEKTEKLVLSHVDGADKKDTTSDAHVVLLALDGENRILAKILSVFKSGGTLWGDTTSKAHRGSRMVAEEYGKKLEIL